MLSKHLLLSYIFITITPTPWWLSGKESGCKAGNKRDVGLIPGLGRCPGEGNGNPLQYSCLGNSMDRGVWWATVNGVAKSWTWLSNKTTTTTYYIAIIDITWTKEKNSQCFNFYFNNFTNTKYVYKFLKFEFILLQVTAL